MRYGIIDLSNLFYRSRHGASMVDTETKTALAQQILFRSLRKLYRNLKIDHFVFAVDHGSWRHSIYPAYKSHRKLERRAASSHEQEENRIFDDALNDLIKFLTDHTRCTILHAPEIEGDDFVARWIQRHATDDHVIISSDSDFVQLLGPTVSIFDAINQRLISNDAIIDEFEHKLAFEVSPKYGKIKIGQRDDEFIPEPNWWKKALFIRLIRGDIGDSIFSAYPGVRYEGKKCSIRAAWEDTDKGYDWNNLMCQTWQKLVEIRNGERYTKEVQVSDEFRINEQLIDLSKQPNWVIQRMDESINVACQKPKATNIGIHFLRYCNRKDLPDLAKEAGDHVIYLNLTYKGLEHD